MYLQANESVQLGLEAVYQDAAAPTVSLDMVDDIKLTPHVEVEQLMTKNGLTAPSQSYIKRRWSEWNVGGFLTYDVAVYLLDGIFGIDASDPHAYLASMDEEDPTACQSFVLQYGQTGVGMRAAGLMMDKLSIVGDANGPVKFNTHLTGLAAIDDDPETIALAASPLVLGAHSQIFLDPIAGPLGTTELDITGYSFAWNAALPSRVPVWYLGSGIGPGAHRASRWGGNVNLNLEMTATEFTRYMTLVDAINGGVGLEGRLTFTGVEVADILTLDFAGEQLGAPDFSTGTDGIVTLELNLTPKYSADATFLSAWGASIDYAA